jgi:hypothetical protein
MEDTHNTRSVASLPALDPFLGYLPPSQAPYLVTMADIHELFVVQAPFRERREVLFRAFEIYSELIWDRIPYARIWVDGGFTTHKNWAAPDDIDVVVVADNLAPATKRELVTDGLLTLSNVAAAFNNQPLPSVAKMRPFGGLIDAYFATSSTTQLIKMQFSRVRGPDGLIVPNLSKGILEVTRGIS